MRLQLTIHDIAPDELPDVIEAFGTVTVTTHGTTQGTFLVVTDWNEDVRWFHQQVEWLERRVNADDHLMHKIWVAKNREGKDCTEDESAAIKRYWLKRNADSHQTASRLREAFPNEWDEFCEQQEVNT